METISPDQHFYEMLTWFVIVGISAVFGFYSYLMMRLANLTERQEWKHIFHIASGVFLLIGLWRLTVAFYYFDNYTARLTFPITAIVSWSLIAAAGWLVVRWAEGAKERMQRQFRVSQENIELSEAVSKEIIEPLLRNEPVSREKIAEYRVKSANFAASYK